MLVIHGIWGGTSLYLWGEDLHLAKRVAGRRGVGKSKPKPHPFALDSEHLREMATKLVPAPATHTAPDTQITMLFPTDRGPLPSQLSVTQNGEAPKARTAPHLDPWKITALEWSHGEALRLLVELPAGPPTGVVFGDSLRYWAEAAKVCLEVMAQQWFVPTVKADGNGDLRAVWRPLLDEADLAERLRVLVNAMPPVCRALQSETPTPGAKALVTGFLDATVDAMARTSFKAVRSVLSRSRGRKRVRLSLSERWLDALASDHASFVDDRKEADAFEKDVRAWLDVLRPAVRDIALRTCFRLEPPEAQGDVDQSPRSEAPPNWKLSFHLQAMDDRSLLVDATTVWQERSGVLTFLTRRLENPQERLLADLGRASRLFPALEKSLRSRRPTACSLSTEEAYELLKEAAPLLEQSGIGVLVPSWWRKPSARLGVRIKVKASSSGGQINSTGLLGLKSLAKVDWEVALGDQRLSREDLAQLAALKTPLVQVRGQWIEIQPDQIDAALRFFEQGNDRMPLADAVRLGLGEETGTVGLPVVGVEGEGWVGDLLTMSDSETGVEKLAAPHEFQGILRPYQEMGYSWLAFLDRFGLGACLADDMGLGKTIQLISLLLHAKLGHTLLIAPMSVVGNWQREIARFAPSLSVMSHHGPERLAGKSFVEEAQKYDVVLTTYALANRDRETLASVEWERLVLDEAQNIKNPSAKQTQAIRSIGAPHRVALTGTPVENRLSELWSIMDFLNPGYLGSAAEFRRQFAIPIEKYRQADRAVALRKLVQPFVLRRVKTDPTVIQDLPEKLEMKVFCTLVREQASLYEAVVQDMLKQIEDAEGVQRKGLVLATLMKLKQVCNHPAQFLQDDSPLSGRSGKLARLGEMLEETVAAGDRALVFTQFAEMGRMLTGYLRELLGREVLFLHGGVRKAAREEMVQRFQTEASGPPIFVLSIKAGGVGINLTAANHVFHFDRWWNPAVENQATDRAFRIGQRQNVLVHKYVCAGTVEERIDEMIEQKRDLAERIVGSSEDWITEMTTEQLRDLFALSRDAVGEE